MHKAFLDLFGIPANLKVEVFDHLAQDPRVPVADPHFVWSKDLLRDLHAFMEVPAGDGLFLTGPTGCGKSSAVRQYCAVRCWPMVDMTVGQRTEILDLIGHHALRGGQTLFVHGPLALALRDGMALVLNEGDRLDPAQTSLLNGVLDGAPLVIPENGGEIIRPHPRFRLVVTGNSAGQGDATGLYQGVLQQDLAFLDRFRTVRCGYMAAEAEAALLERAHPLVPVDLRTRMVEVANAIRALFMGGDDPGSAQLTVTMSTRTLLRWANLVTINRQAPNPVAYALERALLFRAEPAQALAIARIAADKLGHFWPAETIQAAA